MSTPPRDRSAAWLRWTPGLILLLAVAGLLGWQLLWRDRGPEAPAPPGAGAPDAGGPVEPAPADAEDDPAATARHRLEREWAETTGSAPAWPADLASGGSCRDAVRDLVALCERLDRAPDVRALGLEGGTFGLLTRLSDDLTARPPQVESVLLSLDNAKANVAHVFRVLGRERTAQLLQIAGGHPELAEPLALAVFRWMRAAERCPDDAPKPMPPRTQYAYAAFLINTIGGQAYLRRRAPRHEALLSFYALLIAERSIAARHDPYGVDVVREVERCRELLESQEGLLFRERYLEALDGLERRVAPRG